MGLDLDLDAILLTIELPKKLISTQSYIMFRDDV